MTDIEYANAYYEVIRILEYVNIDDYNKIPSKLINTFRMNANYEHNFEYDVNKTLEEQNVSKRALTVIAILFRDYWATDTQREKIVAKQNYDRQQMEQELMEKYNPDNLFKKKEQVEAVTEKIECKELIEYKEESIFRRILRKIKSIFKK